jgi:hypothetical protein
MHLCDSLCHQFIDLYIIFFLGFLEEPLFVFSLIQKLILLINSVNQRRYNWVWVNLRVSLNTLQKDGQAAKPIKGSWCFILVDTISDCVAYGHVHFGFRIWSDHTSANHILFNSVDWCFKVKFATVPVIFALNPYDQRVPTIFYRNVLVPLCISSFPSILTTWCYITQLKRVVAVVQNNFHVERQSVFIGLTLFLPFL